MSDVKVCLDGEPTEIEIQENRFTLPASAFEEKSGVEVSVRATAGDEELESNSVFVNVASESGEDAPIATPEPEKSGHAHSGCDGGLGVLALATLPVLTGRKRK